MSIKRRAVIFAVLFFAVSSGYTAKSGKAKRHFSKDKAFSLMIPKGHSFGSGKGAVAGWKNSADNSEVAIFPVPAKKAARHENSAFKAAKSARAARKPAENESEFFAKVKKKTAKSGLKFYFFTSYPKDSQSANHQVTGFFALGGSLYRVGGRVSKSPAGLESVYWALGTLKPISRPKSRKRVLNKDGKPGVIKKREENSAGVPLY